MVAIFALCPMVIENVTYTATKLLIAFYVILALRFYLTGWRKQDTLRMTAAFTRAPRRATRPCGRRTWRAAGRR